MKMYYIANARMPNERAHGIQLAKMCEAFIEAGVELTLVLPRLQSASNETLKDFYGLRVDIPIIRLPVLDLGTGPFAFNLRALSFACSSFLFMFVRRFSGERAVVYTIDLDQFSFFLLSLTGYPVFIEVHGSKRVHFLSRFFFRRVRGIVAVNESVCKSLVADYGIYSSSCVVAPNGIDIDFFRSDTTVPQARQALGLSSHAPIFLYSGKFYAWKGLRIFADAASKLPDVLTYFVGGTAAELQSATGLLSLPPNVRCVGHQDFKRMPLWLSAADFFLLSGTREDRYSYYETSPMKLFEYMAARRPIIAARTPAISEIVSEREVLFYEPDDALDLAAKMRYAETHGASFDERVNSAYTKVQSLAWTLRVQKVISFIQETINYKL